MDPELEKKILTKNLREVESFFLESDALRSVSGPFVMQVHFFFFYHMLLVSDGSGELKKKCSWSSFGFKDYLGSILSQRHLVPQRMHDGGGR